MIWMASLLLCCVSGGASADSAPQQTRAVKFKLDGQIFPTYSIFKDVLNSQLFSAKQRICVLTRNFEDRDVGLVLFNASRRALATYIRVEPKRGTLAAGDRLVRLTDDLRGLGLTVSSEESMKNLKLPEPTIIAIDQQAWSVSADLSEMQISEVSVEAAPFTAAEVCAWAQFSAGAKGATQR